MRAHPNNEEIALDEKINDHPTHLDLAYSGGSVDFLLSFFLCGCSLCLLCLLLLWSQLLLAGFVSPDKKKHMAVETREQNATNDKRGPFWIWRQSKAAAPLRVWAETNVATTRHLFAQVIKINKAETQKISSFTSRVLAPLLALSPALLKPPSLRLTSSSARQRRVPSLMPSAVVQSASPSPPRRLRYVSWPVG